MFLNKLIIVYCWITTIYKWKGKSDGMAKFGFLFGNLAKKKKKKTGFNMFYSKCTNVHIFQFMVISTLSLILWYFMIFSLF